MKINPGSISPPATPPTHSPVPHRLNLDCSVLNDSISNLVSSFQKLPASQRHTFLSEVVKHCNNNQLTFLNSLIVPRLQVDFLKELPVELALKVLLYIDSPTTLTQAACTSRYWHCLIEHETIWKTMCERNEYLQDGSRSFREHFRRQFSIERAWRRGGRVKTVEGGISQGLVTSLQFDNQYTVVGCDNHRVEVFDTNTGKKIRTLEGHEGGVWALQYKGDEDNPDSERVLVSGGCDRDVRVWNLNNGQLRHILRGHTSTVRCLKVKDKNLAVTGSRDMTLRVWDIQSGLLLHVLVGHLGSVRCVDINGDTCVSGSYDFTGRIWDLKTGRCRHVLIGHTLQIYAIVTNGTVVATGSMDAHIRIWSVETGECLAVLHGHTSLVGQLQLTDKVLVSGGSDGCLRVWDIKTFECLQQFSAHDGAINCLQFNEQYILSASNDGKIKLWDIKHGSLIRNFTQSSKIAWKVQFNKTKAVVLVQKKQTDDESQPKTIMEIHDFDFLP
ncbi:WD40-repeat-containing domain protein [Sporodiniella umbellata]|nr:WD40-repeat-containing domain protein [Sporodiniella umbellata]